jgi:hypothetical protein
VCALALVEGLLEGTLVGNLLNTPGNCACPVSKNKIATQNKVSVFNSMYPVDILFFMHIGYL